MTIAVRRSSTLPIAAIVAVTFAAWIAFVSVGMSSAGIAIFLLGWVAMMTAMMLPSVAPLVLVFGKRGRGRLVLGYLLVWAVAGLPVYAIARAADLMMVPAEVEAAVLVAAGVVPVHPPQERLPARLPKPARLHRDAAGDAARCDSASSTAPTASAAAGR